jgi:hypothetical protein
MDLFKVIATCVKAFGRIFQIRYPFLLLRKPEETIFKQDILFLTVPNLVDTFINQDNSC